MSRRRDAALTGALLLLALALVRIVDAGVRPAGLVVGAVGAAVAEAVAHRYERRVRAAWRRPSVRAGSALVAAGGIGASATVVPDWGLSVAVGALGGYLLLLALVAGRVALRDRG